MSTKKLHVTMPDGAIWEVPYDFIAEIRAAYYAEHDTRAREGSAYEQALAVELAAQDGADVIDWAHNNMNWSDVAHLATEVLTPARTVDYQEGWTNGKMDVVG